MLTSLSIKNIALIDSIQINFSSGLNVLSGETGAGKSIIIDSLNFVLGKRADKSLIKYGEDSATCSAIFNISNIKSAKKILEEFNIEYEDEIYIKRTMSVDGKNICNINGEKVPLSMLKQLTSTLVDIYGQNDAMFILNPEKHLDILDEYGGNSISKIKEKRNIIYNQYIECINKLKEYGSLKDLAKNLDLYEYQIKEIEEANVEDNEEENLIQIRHKMNNFQFLVSALNTAYEALNGNSQDTNSLSLISLAQNQLNKVSQYDEEIQSLLERLDSSKIELKDIAQSIQNLSDSLEYNPQELSRIEQRISQIRLIKRKYGDSYQEINNYLKSIKEKYEFLSSGEEIIKDLEIDRENYKKELYDNAVELSKQRRSIAEELNKKIESELKELGMKNAKFVAAFNEIEEYSDDMTISINGIDEMEFLFSANLGQPVRQLTKIISGGELSRFTLALKNTIANLDGINTMVFDEIDTGISGNTAQIVAEKLYQISKNKQVLAITHLPQLASFADKNYLIEKYTIDNNTKTKVTLLDGENLVNEIVRLIGGINLSNNSKTFANEMLQNAKNKKSII